MPLSRDPEFEDAYTTFMARYAPSSGSDQDRLAFSEQLRHLLDLAGRDHDAPSGERIRVSSRQISFQPHKPRKPDIESMRRLNDGWIARLKREEEMGQTVPWPA